MQSIPIYNDGIGKVDLVESMGSDLKVVNAARVSYGKHKTELDEGDIKLIRYLLKNKHTSPFEHNLMTFRFKVPLFVRSQHHRHRVWKFNEISRRYSGENLEFYFPNEWRKQSKDNKQCSGEWFNSPAISAYVEKHAKDSVALYEKMIDEGVARELARIVLPQNLYTEYYGTIDLHNALHFLKLRLHSHAQWEIQVVAEAMRDIMNDLYPYCMKAYNDVCN